MFDLKDLPTHETLRRFAEAFPALDIPALETWLLLSRVTADLITQLDNRLAQHGLSQTKFFVLILLKRNPSGLGLGALAEGVGVSGPTMTGIIDRLEASGDCVRERHGFDRRAYVVSITPAGNERISSLLPSHYAWVADVMSGLSPAEKLAMQNLLQKIKT